MIGFLRGRVAHMTQDEVWLDVGGVGYRVTVPLSVRAQLPPAGAECTLYTFLHVREDAMTLYGFSAPEEERQFQLLLSVSGVGPKVALSVLSSLSPERLRQAVLYSDEAILQKIPGVGKKTAQRMILELKDKVAGAAGEAAAGMAAGVSVAGSGAGGAELPGNPVAEALEALTGLGYTRSEAGQVLDKARRRLGDAATAEQLVREALKAMV